MSRLYWTPAIGLDEALALTVDWYRAFRHGADLRSLSFEQVERVLSGASS